MTANAVKGDDAKTGWLVDNCNCTERNNLKCPEGFVLESDIRLCRNKSEVTNVLLGCSKYDCNEEIYSWINEKWQKNQN